MGFLAVLNLVYFATAINQKFFASPELHDQKPFVATVSQMKMTGSS